MSDDEELVQRGAAFLYAKGARRVWLFGARASNHVPDAHSDLDYVTEGIPPQRLYSMAKELEHATGVEVDLVDMRSAPPRLRPHILRTRVLLPRQQETRRPDRHR